MVVWLVGMYTQVEPTFTYYSSIRTRLAINRSYVRLETLRHQPSRARIDGFKLHDPRTYSNLNALSSPGPGQLAKYTSETAPRWN